MAVPDCCANLQQGVRLGIVLEASCQDGALLFCEDGSAPVRATLAGAETAGGAARPARLVLVQP